VEPCINGQVGAVGAYFGQDVRGIVDRLLAEQLRDGGWNCEAANGSTRSSFNTTICVLEALLEHERVVGASAEVTAARLRGHEYLLERRLFRRRSTGEVIERDRKGGAAWTRFASRRGGTTTCCEGSTICAAPASCPMSAWPRRSNWSRPSPTTTAGGRSRLSTLARCPVETDEGGPAEPVEYVARLARVEVVFRRRLSADAAARDRRRAELARSVTLSMLRWPNQPVAVMAWCAAAEAERWTA
jgi:hypothetical protein